MKTQQQYGWQRIYLLGFILFQFYFTPVIAQNNCYVDLIVAYTPEASQEAGSDSMIVKQIQDAVLEMNIAYMNSRINHWVRLVRTVKVSYTESGCFLKDLDAFWKGTDSSLAKVHQLREIYKADLGALIITNKQFCGLPVSDTSVATSSTAFCAIQYDCMRHNLSLAHMFGHMYGCGHAQYELDSAGQGVAFSYGHGYHWNYSECANFYTIMGITDDVNCYGQGEYDCNVINYFSNPDVLYRGVPTGNKDANNAKVLNDHALLLAGFYPIPQTDTLTDTVYTADFAMGIALNVLSTGSSYEGRDSSSIYFCSGKQIILEPGFTMNEGTYFETIIDSSLSNCNLTAPSNKRVRSTDKPIGAPPQKE